MKYVLVLGIGVAVALVGLIGWAWTAGSFGREFGMVAELPWGVVSLVDLYLGLALAAAWVMFRERTWLARSAWAIGIFVLGNVAVGAYVAVAAGQAMRAGDVHVFFSGRRPSSS